MPADLRIWLLGGFRVEVAGQTVADGEWRRHGATALVKILALQHRLHREQAVDLLWPDAGLTLGGSRLNKALHFARRVLGADRIRLRDDMLGLEPAGLWIDVDAFEAAAKDGDHESALSLYTGDLLPENRFDGWAEARRGQLRQAVVPLLLDRARDDDLERLVALDPLHEEAYGRLIRLEVERGHRHLAVRWYERLAEALRTELGVEPHNDLKRLHQSLLRSAPTPAPPSTPADREERKLVTVLDADLRGVRGEAADADPERARREVSAWTDLLGGIVEKWGGAVQRLVGGGVIGVFGYPTASEDHAARALRAGHEILQRSPGAVRLGVDTGQIIAPAGPDGLARIGGSILDNAARLRAAAGPRTLLATERTRRAAREFRFGPATGPGGASPLLSPGPQPVADQAAPMVGRAAELSAVLSLIDEAAASGRPRLITVAGPAGIGKTRLVQEVVAKRPALRVLRGRCLAAGEGITYWALGEILREACGIPFGDPAGDAPQRLRSSIRQLFDPAAPDLDATIFALATTAAVRLPGNPLDHAEPRDVAAELGRAWPRLATAYAARGPLLLIVEDLHWAGAPLVTMLTRLVSRSSGPVVVLTTARPEFLESSPAQADVVSLRALPERESGALLDALPHAFDQRRRAQIMARADGNPYFLDQLAAHVAEGGESILPDTLHALLAARVDRLPAAEKQVLQAASVMGRAFWAAPLRADPEQLAALENRGLVRARQTPTVQGQDEYVFQHALLRDVAYASLPVARRAAGHAAVAAWLEEVSRERIGEVIELVAVHYAAAAGDPDADEWVRGKAFRSLITAGAGARRRNAVDRALDLHRLALRYAADPGERAEALEATGDDHEIAYDGDGAVQAWGEAIATLRDAGSHADRRAGLCLKTAQMVVARWGGFRVPADPALGDRVIDEGLAAVTDPPTKAQLLALRAMCGGRWAWTGRTDPLPVAGRRTAATDACRLADRLGSPAVRSLALMGLTAVHFQEGHYDDAVTTVLDQVVLVEQEGRERDRALGHAIAALIISAVRGDYHLALEHALRSYEWAATLSPHDRLHGTGLVLTCLEQLGRWSEVDPYLDEHLRLRQGPVAAMSCPYIRSGPLLGALALARRGEPERARSVAATVVPDLSQPGNAEAVRARLSVELGDPAAARELAGRLTVMGRRPGPEEIPHEALAMVEALEALGDHAALRAFLPVARSAGGYLAQIVPACDRAEGLAAAAADDRETAVALLTRAAEGYDRLRLEKSAARVRVLL